MEEPFWDEENKTLYGPDEVCTPEPKGIGYAFYTCMKRNRNAIGQIEAETGYKEHFDTMLKRSIRTAIELKQRGIQPGDIVSLCSVNNNHNAIPFFATQMIGGVMASFDPTLSILDTVHLMKQITPKIIFVSENAENLIEESIKQAGVEVEIVTFGDNNKFSNFREFLEPKDGENDFQPYEVDDIKKTAVILFSSGTTGLSKGICVTHYGMFFQAHSLASNGSITDVMLSYATSYWVSTVIVLCINALFGKTRVIAKWNAKEIWEIIEKYKVTFVFLAPSQAMMILKSGRPEGVDTTSLHDAIIGGGPLSAENNLAFRDILPGTFVYLIYGQSECCGLVTCFRPGYRKDVLLFHERPLAVGRPMNGFKYKIVNPESLEELGPNCTGELRYFHNGIMKGYYKRDSAEAFDENGWIQSGDIAYFDDDFCFYIVDRIKEMLKYQAYHIPPARIEGVLLQHPSVAAAVVIGIPNEEDGDHPMGVVVLRPGYQVTEDELIKLVDDTLDYRYKLRGGVKIVDSLPYTPSGKVKKLFLKNKILAGEI